MERHWSEGRIVVLRPDVPGKRFNPNDSWVLRTDEDRALAEVALASVAAGVRDRLENGQQPMMVEALLQLSDEPPNP